MFSISATKSPPQIIYNNYIKKKIDPNFDPCGTPLKTDFQFETSQSIAIWCACLFLKTSLTNK